MLLQYRQEDLDSTDCFCVLHFPENTFATHDRDLYAVDPPDDGDTALWARVWEILIRLPQVEIVHFKNNQVVFGRTHTPMVDWQRVAPQVLPALQAGLPDYLVQRVYPNVERVRHPGY